VADSTWSRVGEINYVAKAAQQRRIKIALHVGREDSWAMVPLHALQEVIYLTIGVSVMAVLNLAPADKQGISLIEEEDVSAILGYIEDSSQILFRLCNVLTDDCREVDTEKVKVQLSGKYLSSHALVSAALTSKKTVKGCIGPEFIADGLEVGLLGVGQRLPESRRLDVPNHALQFGRHSKRSPFASLVLIHLKSLLSQAWR
jgi:hypothetical protein